jgi:trk system potassium uptake protein TrkH
MILGSLNFSLYYAALRGKIYRFYQSEFFLYGILVLVASGLVSWYLVGTSKVLLTHQDAAEVFSISDAVRYGTFQIVSAITTTGFSNANYDVWPYLPQAIMLLVMFLGGMSGSTSGGIKTVRLIMLFRIAQHKIETLFRPESVRFLKVEGKEVDNGAALMALCFFLMITAVSVGGIILYIGNGIDPETAISLVGCMINDTGMTFRVGGPLDSCAFLSNFGTGLSSLLMILGRLEFFAIFAFFVPSFWKHS